jgi:transglutaminase-like putative cysteine protease
VRATGVIDGDSLLVLAVGGDEGAPVDTQHIRLSGPILLPTLVPLAIALGDEPEVGKQYDLPMFDPLAMKPRQVAFRVDAESSFVVYDSAGFDAPSKRWRPLLPATVRAWHVRSEGTDGGAAAFSGWIDEQGRVVATSQLGFDLRRRPYELAFENWRLDTRDRGDVVEDDRDILESTAIAAGKRVHGAMPELRVRLTNVDLAGYDLDGGRQRLRGDTLTIEREGSTKLDASYTLPVTDRELFRYTRPEPLLQTRDPGIARLARQLKNRERDPRVVAARIAAWVHDSLKKEITFGVPDAAAVLRARSGDCNEHTQLYVALARAAGIPTRIAAGLASIDGKFYYHAWPEVYLQDWVAVDPTFGQFPADAAHLRFTVGGLGRQTQLLRLMGNLRIDVLR